jgi:hypothetical protein
MNWGSKSLAAILYPHGLCGGNRKSKIPFPNNYGYKPLKGSFGSSQAFYIGRMSSDRNLLSLDASLVIPTRILRFKVPDCIVAHRSDRCSSPIGSVPTGLALLQLRLRFFGLVFVDQPRSPVVFW